MEPNEIKGERIAQALAACPALGTESAERDALWFVVQEAICTRGTCMVTPLGSSSTILVTPDHASEELLAAMEWLTNHEQEARSLSGHALFIKLRGVATRGGAGSGRAVQRDQLHGLTHVSPGDPVVFDHANPMDAAS